MRFARPRFDTYDTIDFLVVLLGYAASAEPSLKAFSERLLPFGSLFMALFGHSELPSLSALNRFLAAFDQSSIGEYRQELAQACQVIIRYAGHFRLPLSSSILRLDGFYGCGVVIADLVQTGLGCLGRCKDDGLLDLPAVHARLMLPSCFIEEAVWSFAKQPYCFPFLPVR